jgi:hypothetical protein
MLRARNVKKGQDHPMMGKRKVMEILVLLGLFALWTVLQIWVRPKAGAST